MSAPDLDQLELTLLNLRGGVLALRAIAENMSSRGPEGPGLEFIAAGLEREVDEARAWFEAAHEAKGSGPLAVT